MRIDQLYVPVVRGPSISKWIQNRRRRTWADIPLIVRLPMLGLIALERLLLITVLFLVTPIVGQYAIALASGARPIGRDAGIMVLIAISYSGWTLMLRFFNRLSRNCVVSIENDLFGPG